MRAAHPVVLVLVPIVLWGAWVTGAQDPPGESVPFRQGAAPGFTVRSNPEWVERINAFLGEIAVPVVAALPGGAVASDYLKNVCGGYVPAQYEVSEDAKTIRFAPCLRFKRNAEVEVTPGDTLEGLAVRSGLSRADATTLAVKSSGGSSRRSDPADLRIGDVVVIPRVPLWTQVTANADKIPDRASFVSALAERLQCAGRGSAEDCLLRLGVVVLDRGGGSPQPDLKPPPPVTELKAPVSARPTIDRAPSRSRETAAAAAVAVSADLAVPPTPAGAPVDEKQWPYDPDLLAVILTDPAVVSKPATIGIADGGLAARTGAPLAAALFDHGPDRPDDNDIDDDENLYVDDGFGAGMPRPKALAGSGNIGLCDIPPDFATWSVNARALFSHGSIVASIAAGLSLRARPGVGSLLPRIVFFRMLQNACTQDSDYRVGGGEMVTAFEYLQSRSKIVTISYTMDSSANARVFTAAMKDTLPYYDRLLVLPAGNDLPGDLDQNPICPACLGNDSLDSRTARRTLVVGAATRDLKRASYSNFGEHTVRIYAPGEPIGAVDVTGQPATAAGAATSYAAPYVALAAGIMQSLGITETADVLDRLMAATWPLNDPLSRPERTGVGILDLTKAAAVQHDAVEVTENDPIAGLVRRTYVGTLIDALKDVSVCSGQPFQSSAVQALKLGAPRSGGERTVHVYWRNKKDQSGRRLVQPLTCRPSGDVRIRTVNHGDQVFPLSSVNEILMRW